MATPQVRGRRPNVTHWPTAGARCGWWVVRGGALPTNRAAARSTSGTRCRPMRSAASALASMARRPCACTSADAARGGATAWTIDASVWKRSGPTERTATVACVAGTPGTRSAAAKSTARNQLGARVRVGSGGGSWCGTSSWASTSSPVHHEHVGTRCMPSCIPASIHNVTTQRSCAWWPHRNATWCGLPRSGS